MEEGGRRMEDLGGRRKEVFDGSGRRGSSMNSWQARQVIQAEPGG